MQGTYDSTAVEAKLHIVPDQGCRLFRRVQPGRRPASAVPREEGWKFVRAKSRHCNALHKTSVPLTLSSESLHPL